MTSHFQWKMICFVSNNNLRLLGSGHDLLMLMYHSCIPEC